MMDPSWWDATSQAEAIRTGAVSSVDLLSAQLDRIEKLDPVLRAFVALDVDRALAEAASVDAAVAAGRADELGPFAGVAASIKDVIHVEGLPTTHSCKVLADTVAGADAPLVGRLRRAGFLVLGKTNVPEFCTSMASSQLNGTCRNPWDLDRTPGGSSGGAAAAVAAGLCTVAHGTDGAGSVRVPAAFCGLVGIKPTRGRITFDPDVENAYFGSSVDGILSRSVRDAAAVLDVFTGWHDQEPVLTRPDRRFAGSVGSPTPLRVAVTATAPFGDVDEVCEQAAMDAAALVESLGHDVADATPPWATILEAVFGPMSAPGPGYLVGRDRLDEVEPRNRWLVESSHDLTVVEHARYVEHLRACARRFLAFWDDVDVVLTPTAGILPPPVDWAPWHQTREEHMATFATFPNFAQPFNLSGQPALSLPLAWSTSGLPIGIQLAGRMGEEATLFGLAAQLEGASPSSRERPPICD